MLIEFKTSEKEQNELLIRTKIKLVKIKNRHKQILCHETILFF